MAYRYYNEQGYSHPGLIGTACFQRCAQDFTGLRNDGGNYNCGLIDVADRLHKYQVEAMAKIANRLYEVHFGLMTPYNQQPVRARGHEQILDIWNE